MNYAAVMAVAGEYPGFTLLDCLTTFIANYHPVLYWLLMPRAYSTPYFPGSGSNYLKLIFGQFTGAVHIVYGHFCSSRNLNSRRASAFQAR